MGTWRRAWRWRWSLAEVGTWRRAGGVHGAGAGAEVGTWRRAWRRKEVGTWRRGWRSKRLGLGSLLNIPARMAFLGRSSLALIVRRSCWPASRGSARFLAFIARLGSCSAFIVWSLFRNSDRISASSRLPVRTEPSGISTVQEPSAISEVSTEVRPRRDKRITSVSSKLSSACCM